MPGAVGRTLTSGVGVLAPSGALLLLWLLTALALLPVATPAASAQSGAAPVITSLGPFTVDEGTTAVASLTATDEDTGSEKLTWSIPADSAGGLDRAQFSLTTAGVLSFTAAKDFENPDDNGGDGVYNVTVQVSDGANTDSADLTVTLRNVTELLSAISGPATVSHAENAAVRVGAYSASSAQDAAGVTWSLSGDDSGDFEIAGGVLRFKLPPPDYESPDDTGADNGYAVTLQAAAGDSSVTLDVTATVSDVNEAGVVTFSTARPSLGTALTASVADPDSDSAHAETVTWTWERSRGRTGWTVISGATAASYTPTAADSESYLRATASYTDRIGSGRSASAVTPNPPLAHKLSALSISGSVRAMYPAFTPEVLHYAVECGDGDTMALSWSAADAATRVAVNGVQRASQSGSLSLTGLTGASDIVIALSGATGASTTYVIHCLGEDFPDVTTVKRTGATEGLIGFVRRFDAGQGQWFSHLMIIDNNGVPRYRERIANRVNHFRLHPGGAHPYSYSERDRDPNPPSTRDLHSLHVVLDAYLKEVARVWTVPPLRRTDNHDFTITPGGNYVLMSYEPRDRDFSDIRDNAGNVLTDDQGQPYGTRNVRDSDIQIITPEGQQLSLWSSWDHMAIEDCTQHRFPDGYAHINSLQFHDGDVIAAFRGCSKVLRIDPETGTTVWRVGRSYRTSEQWTASGEPEPLTIVGDPYLEFCGLHSAKILGNGNLLLFDNGGHCVINPVTGTSMRESAKFARGVEYAIDTVNGEAIFQAHHSLHGQFAHYSLASGHIEAMSNGDWLISWGRALIDNDPNTGKPPDESATQVDPATGTEKFSITVTAPSNTPLAQRERLAIRAYPMEPVALAPDLGALSGAFPASSHTSASNPGAANSARVVVAFSRPVVDFAASTASLSVQGATIASVSAHVVAGEAANAYLVTLTPDGDGAITVSLVADKACASGGVCTADGTTLTDIPSPLVIGSASVAAPPVFFGAAPPVPTPSDADFAWTVSHDLALEASQRRSTGLWSDGATLWILRDGDGADDAVSAHDLETGERVEEREFAIDDRNPAPRGIQGNGRGIAWVSDSARDRLFAYDLASGERAGERDIELAAANDDARGIWSDGATLWVLDGNPSLHAYDLAGGELLGEYGLDPANGDPHGLWSDGVSVWVSNDDPDRLFAYRLPEPGSADAPAEAGLERVRDEDFSELSNANTSPRGIWSGGGVMYVADGNDDKVYSYNMPDALDARLAALHLSEVDIGEFGPDRTGYTGVVAAEATEAVVTAEAMQPRAGIEIDPADADAATDGHQVALEGLAEVTVTVTSADGARKQVYSVRLVDGEARAWPHCLRGGIGAGFNLVVYEGGGVDDLVSCAQSRGVAALYALHEGAWLHYIPGAPDFVNARFRELYADGAPAFTPLLARSDGPAGKSPAGDIAVPRWPDCLHGDVAVGFSLVLYKGGSLEDLATCARSRGVTALYALAGGTWTPYTFGAPEFVNRPFAELFAKGLPPVTPLVAKSDGPPAGGTDGDGGTGN